ncbi:MAG: hypothetical protein ABJZ55_23415 [Fuerstiella sp.]
MKFGRLSLISTALVSVLLIAAPVLGQSQSNAGRSVNGNSGSSDSASRGRAVGSKWGGDHRGVVDGKRGSASAVSQNSASTKVLVQDVVLNSSGYLTFTVVQSTGRPVVGNPIAVLAGSVQVAAAKTNAKGQVRISGLKPGLHVFQTGYTKSMVRLWPAGAAPPQAVKDPAIVDASDLVRGQYGYGPPMAPGLVAATVTALGVGAVVIGKSSGSESSVAVDPASP